MSYERVFGRIPGGILKIIPGEIRGSIHEQILKNRWTISLTEFLEGLKKEFPAEFSGKILKDFYHCAILL